MARCKILASTPVCVASDVAASAGLDTIQASVLATSSTIAFTASGYCSAKGRLDI